MQNYKQLYETNAAFNTYVNKYVVKHEVSVDEAIQHVIVRDYGDYILSKGSSIVPPTVSQVDVGCGGC